MALWVNVASLPEPPPQLIPGQQVRWAFCRDHNIWHYTDDCPACQTLWPDSPVGEPCQECARCIHGGGGFPKRAMFCPHRCEAIICHPGQDCERTPS